MDAGSFSVNPLEMSQMEDRSDSDDVDPADGSTYTIYTYVTLQRIVIEPILLQFFRHLADGAFRRSNEMSLVALADQYHQKFEPGKMNSSQQPKCRSGQIKFVFASQNRNTVRISSKQRFVISLIITCQTVKLGLMRLCHLTSHFFNLTMYVFIIAHAVTEYFLGWTFYSVLEATLMGEQQ